MKRGKKEEKRLVGKLRKLIEGLIIMVIKMSDELFMHSSNPHEAYRMFAESTGADFEPAYNNKEKL